MIEANRVGPTTVLVTMHPFDVMWAAGVFRAMAIYYEGKTRTLDMSDTLRTNLEMEVHRLNSFAEALNATVEKAA